MWLRLRMTCSEEEIIFLARFSMHVWQTHPPFSSLPLAKPWTRGEGSSPRPIWCASTAPSLAPCCPCQRGECSPRAGEQRRRSAPTMTTRCTAPPGTRTPCSRRRKLLPGWGCGGTDRGSCRSCQRQWSFCRSAMYQFLNDSQLWVWCHAPWFHLPTAGSSKT